MNTTLNDVIGSEFTNVAKTYICAYHVHAVANDETVNIPRCTRVTGISVDIIIEIAWSFQTTRSKRNGSPHKSPKRLFLVDFNILVLRHIAREIELSFDWR